MNNTQHTPGPWRQIDVAPHIVLADTDTDFNIVADCGTRHRLAPEKHANARLIAAAPELLEALEEVVAVSDRDHDAWTKARAAIAKAKGGRK